MFEPAKLIVLATTLLLLAPMAYVFWLMVTVRLPSESENRARLEEAIHRASQEVPPQGEQPEAISVRVTVATAMNLYPGCPPWLTFFPRRWLGLVGLMAVAVIALAICMSLFFPGPNALSSQ
jgi:hypothetical protein